MTLFEYYDRQIPDYYEGMHRDGYEPWQILHAAHRKIKKAYYAQREAEEAALQAAALDEPVKVKITSEVKIK